MDQLSHLVTLTNLLEADSVTITHDNQKNGQRDFVFALDEVGEACSLLNRHFLDVAVSTLRDGASCECRSANFAG